MFFGLSALMTAVFASLGLHQPVLQLLLFAVFSVVSVFLIRKRLVSRSQGFEGDADARVQLSASIAAGREATIQYQGVPWTAKNIAGQDLAAGEWALRLRVPWDPKRFRSATSAGLVAAIRAELDALLLGAAARRAR